MKLNASYGKSEDTILINTTVESPGLQKYGTIGIVLTGIINPPSLMPFENLQLSLLDQNSNLMTYNDKIAIQTKYPAHLSALSGFIRLNNRIKDINAKYQFELVVTNPMPIGGSIEIQVPKEVTIQSNVSLICNITCDKTTAKLTWNNSTRVLKITNFLNSFIDSGTLISFQI